MNWIDNNSTALLQKSLAYTWEKQRITQENIANKSTPGYKAKYMDFEAELQRSIQQMKSGGTVKPADFKAKLDSLNFNVQQNNEQSSRLDGNNVDSDVESVELARTQLQYEFLVRQITDQFVRLRTVIEGR